MKYQHYESEHHSTVTEFSSFKVESKIECTYLSWIQRTVCKLFKIIPQAYYLYVVRVKVKGENKIRATDFIILDNNTKWNVLESNEESITVTNLNKLSYLENINSAVVIISGFFEGCGVNRSF